MLYDGIVGMCSLLTLLTLTTPRAGALAVGQWIQPVYEDEEPRWEPRPLFWYRVEGNPVVYRKEINVVRPLKMAPVMANTSRYCYIFVDDREIYGWEPARRADKPPEMRFFTDLTDALSPGKHVLWVSAPRDGVALTGFMEYADGSREPVCTDESWQVKKFPSSTILESQPFVKPGGATEGWVPTMEDADQALLPDEPALLDAYYTRELDRLQETLSEASWRLDLLTQKGIVLENWESYGWGDAARISPTVRRAAARIIPHIAPAQADLDGLRRRMDLDRQPGGFDRAQAKIRDLDAAASAFSHLVMAEDRARFLSLLSNSGMVEYGKAALGKIARMEEELEDRDIPWAELSERAPQLNAQLRGKRSELAKSWNHPVNELNQSRYNKLGWIPVKRLVDSELGDWGIRVSLPKIPWSMDAPRKWWLMLDPDNQGLAEKRESYGYNIEAQWPTVEIGKSWESQKFTDENPNFPENKPCPSDSPDAPRPYDGYAWYRTRMMVPEEWRGYELALVADRADDWDWAYFNGQLVGQTGDEVPEWWRQPRRYMVPSGIVKYGEENVIAWRIYDAGGEGMLGEVRLECPSLRGAKAKGTHAETLSTPLFPGAVITPAKVLQMTRTIEMKEL